MSLMQKINDLASTSSNNERLAKLEKYSNDKDIQWFFGACFASNEYKLRDLSKYPKSEDTHETDITTIQFFLKELVEAKSAKNYAIEYLPVLSPEERVILERILKHDPRCGVGIDTWKKVFNIQETAFEPKLCKATSSNNKLLQNFKFPCIAQRKEDGARCLIKIQVHKNGNITADKVISSSGKDFKQLHAFQFGISQELTEMNKVEQLDPGIYILDGELLVWSETSEEGVCDRKTGNGILNKSIKNTISNEEAERIFFVCWDIITEKEFNANKGTIPYKQRLWLLERLLPNDSHWIQLVETKKCNDIEEAMEFYRRQRYLGKEGAILKEPNSIWENKRLKTQLKLKLEAEVTLKCVGWVTGNIGTKYENVVGSLACETDDGKISVYVGTGLSDEERISYMEADFPIYVEVVGNDLIQDVNDGTWSIFLPRFKGLRFDKTESDTFEEIRHIFNR